MKYRYYINNKIKDNKMASLLLYMEYYTFYLKIIIYISNFKCFVTKGNYFFIKIVNTYYTKI